MVGVIAAGAAGILAGIGVVRLRPVFIAVTTWILTWTVTLFLLAFRSVSGGAQGIVVPSGLSVDAHYEVALALLVVTIAIGALFGRSGAGIELRAARQVPAAAAGVAAARRRLGAVASLRAAASPAGSRSNSPESPTQVSTGRISRSVSSSPCSSAVSRRRSALRPASRASRS